MSANQKPSFVKALTNFFGDNNDGFGRKLEIPEIKALSTQDKHDLSAQLMDAGIDHMQYTPAKV